MKRVTRIIAILAAAILFGIAVSVVFAQGPRGMQCAIVHPLTSGTLSIEGGPKPVLIVYFHRMIGDSLVVPELPDALYCKLAPQHLDTLPNK